MLSEDDKKRIAELRKVNPDSAKNLERRLRRKKGKNSKDNQSYLLSLVNPVEHENDVNMDILPPVVHIPANMESMKDLFDKFYQLEQNTLVKQTYNYDSDSAPEDTILQEKVQTALKQNQQRKKPTDDDDENDNSDNDMPSSMTRKKLRKLLQPDITELKAWCPREDLLEIWDATSDDPWLVCWIKSIPNTVPVPGHWCQKSRYLSKKRAVEKTPYRLPDYIEDTGIARVRAAIQEKEAKLTLKQKMREKARPKSKKMDINYQVLHDAFFKYGMKWKPYLSKPGDLFYEGKEQTINMKRFKPGVISEKLKQALGIISDSFPPPWLHAMQQFGPPPGWPKLKIPGVNTPLPPGVVFGFQAGGWGAPPSDFHRVTAGLDPLIALREALERKIEQEDKSLWGAIDEIPLEQETVNQAEDDFTDIAAADTSGLQKVPDVAIKTAEVAKRELVEKKKKEEEISRQQAVTSISLGNLKHLLSAAAENQSLSSKKPAPPSLIPAPAASHMVVPQMTTTASNSIFGSQSVVYDMGVRPTAVQKDDSDKIREQLAAEEQKRQATLKSAGLVESSDKSKKKKKEKEFKF